MSRFWSGEDVKKGLCEWTQVGTPKPPALEREFEVPPDYGMRSVEDLLTLYDRAKRDKLEIPAFKDAVLKAYYLMGGVRSLVEWGRSHQTKFYQLAAKLIPQEVHASLSTSGEIVLVPALPPPSSGDVRALTLTVEQIVASVRLLPDHERERLRLLLATPVQDASQTAQDAP